MQLMAAAFGKIRTTKRMLRLVRLWRYAAQAESSANTVDCLRTAESLARSALDWAMIAVTYSDFQLHFNRHVDEKIRFCMRRAEAQSETSGDWEECACSWFCIWAMDCSEETIRCFKLAVEKAHKSMEFSRIAFDCIYLFAHPSIADALIHKAEDLACSQEDWQNIREAYYAPVVEEMRDSLKNAQPYLPIEFRDGKISRVHLPSIFGNRGADSFG